MFHRKQRMFRTYPLCGTKGNLFFFFYNPLASLYRFFHRRPISSSFKEDPHILLCCEAAFGDVLLATSIIPSLKKKFPQSKIGFLCKKETFSVLETVRGIDKVHLSGLKNRKKLLKEIEKEGYDASFELHPFFRSSIRLIRKTNIPVLIGFDSGGYDVWLTDPVPFPQKIEYLPNLYALLLKQVAISTVRPRPELNLKLPSLTFPDEYVVLHLGTSHPLKEWEIDKWKELAEHLREKGFSLLFTGKGLRERLLINQVAKEEENFCDRLNWNDFASVIEQAKALISVDSVSLHLAALFNIPTLGLYLYSHGVELWLPDSDQGTYLVGKNCIFKMREKNTRAIVLEEVSALEALKYLPTYRT